MQKMKNLVLACGLVLGVAGCGPSAEEIAYKKALDTPRPLSQQNTPENMAKWSTPKNGESPALALKNHFRNRNN